MKSDLNFWLYVVILINSVTSILIGVKFGHNYDVIVGIILFIIYLFLLMRWYKDHDLRRGDIMSLASDLMEEKFDECIQEMESLRGNPRECDSPYDTAVSWSNEMLDKRIEIVRKYSGLRELGEK